ncbi:hypothetical protein B0I35DRAFT_204358 [Stachybotrys elegans]|uniref:Secreted protein n=1 Tax=Stachybotrys elegans TaxID=80388 RepID=A0A8K0SZF4_9HYPO|nr:hypothetical protein B0I35DRAFT_204358 [Stachybotrys elegans]
MMRFLLPGLFVPSLQARACSSSAHSGVASIRQDRTLYMSTGSKLPTYVVDTYAHCRNKDEPRLIKFVTVTIPGSAQLHLPALPRFCKHFPQPWPVDQGRTLRLSGQ